MIIKEKHLWKIRNSDNEKLSKTYSFLKKCTKEIELKLSPKCPYSKWYCKRESVETYWTREGQAT